MERDIPMYIHCTWLPIAISRKWSNSCMGSYVDLDINDYPKFIKPIATYLYVTIFVKKWFQTIHKNFVHHQSIDTNKQTMWPVADLGFSEGGG